MATRTATARVEVLALDRELWCRDCLLSTGATVWYVVTCGPNTHSGVRRECGECGGRNVEGATS